jgi:hypothetical protein
MTWLFSPVAFAAKKLQAGSLVVDFKDWNADLF